MTTAPLKTCPQCQGLSGTALQQCLTCHKRFSVFLQLPQAYIFWGRSYSSSAIAAIRLQRLFNNLVDALLIIIFSGGVIGLGVHLSSVWSSNNSFFMGPLLVPFWLGVLACCVLVGRWGWRSWGVKKVLTKGFEVSDEQPQEVEFKKTKWLDASACTSYDVLAALENAASVAEKDNGSDIQPIHILIGLLRQSGVATIIARLGVPAKSLADELEDLALRDAVVSHGGNRHLTAEAMTAILTAYWSAYQGRHSRIEAADLLRAVAEADERIQKILFDIGITPVKLSNAAAWLQINSQLARQFRSLRAGARLKPKGVMNRAMTAMATPLLDSFSHDLTQLARAGFLMLAVGRDKEINEVWRLWESGRSVLLVGPSGSGKTSIIQALASAMAAETVPQRLQDKRLVELSIPALIAGAGRGGEVEGRILQVFNEIVKAGNILLAVEGLHNLVSVAEGADQTINLSEVFAEGLKRSNCLMVATATPQERAASIDRSPLASLIDAVKVDEPDENTCLQMLAVHVGLVESRENVAFTYDALEKCVQLAHRYIRELVLPAQAIRLMEEVAVYVRKHHGDKPIVGSEDVAAVVAEKTGVPVTSVTEMEEVKLKRLEDEMHKRIVGQDEAVKLVAQALRRARTNLRDPKRPIASFMFLGPTGVGKTELAKTIAEVYFGNEQNMVRLDMSEYQLLESLPQLLGTADGAQVGVLTEAIRRKPFSLLLLDELEKAHPDILNIFLQVMEDGRLTDSLGRTVDFTNVIIIATSNAGTSYIQDQIKLGLTIDKIRTALIQEQLKGIFRPEFINRFDAVVVFAPLTLVEVNEIARRMIKSLAKRLEEKGVFLEVDETAVAEFAQAGFDPIYGARPLRRVLQDKVENTLANYLLNNQLDRRDLVVIKAGGQVEVKQAVREI